MRAQAFGSKIRQWSEHPAIHLGLVRDVATVAEINMALSRLKFDKHSPFQAIGQLAGNDLVWERAHETGQVSCQHFYAAAATITVKRSFKPGRQS